MVEIGFVRFFLAIVSVLTEASMKLNSLFSKGASRILPLAALAAFSSLAGAQSSQTLTRMAWEANARYQTEYNQALGWAALHGWPTAIYEDGEKVAQLVKVVDNLPMYHWKKLLVSARSISADKLWPGGSSGLNVTGAGYTVGIWDGGNVSQHVEFGTRLTLAENSGADSHATSVAGCVAAAGVDPSVKGMAYQANIRSWDANNNIAEITSAANTGLRLSNHSYGFQEGWVPNGRGDGKWAWYGTPSISEKEDWQLGSYGSVARDYDNLMFNAPGHLLVMAAGNDRGMGPNPQPVDHWVRDASGTWVSNTTTVRDLEGGTLGYDCIPSDTTMKNALVIGAVRKNQNGYQGPSSVIMSDFSVWGPTDDGRIKPDLVAPGVNIRMPEPGNRYGFSDGTSFASPIVTGAVALIGAHYQNALSRTPRAATLKALAIQGADECGSNPGPDYAFGFGQINPLKSAQVISKAKFNPNLITEFRLSAGQTRTIPLNVGSGGEVRATLVWNDPAGVVSTAALNNRSKKLINDLDMRIVHVATGTVFTPWKLDVANPSNAATTGDNSTDNVEQIVIPTPLSGEYQVRINAKGASLRPSGFQDATVVISAPASGGFSNIFIDPGTVLGGLVNSTGTVVLLAPKTTDTVVELISSNPSAATVPATVVVPANQTTASFLITSRPVQTTQLVTILAGNSGATISGQLTVEPVSLQNSLFLTPAEIVGGQTSIGTVTLQNPAPSGGSSVNLSTSNAFVAKPTRNVIIVPAGQTSATFQVETFAVAEPRNVTITARRGSVTSTAVIRVVRAGLQSFTTSASSVGGSGTITGRVLLNGPAPTGGATVQVVSGNSNAATVPSSVLVPQGLREATFTIRGRSVSSSTQVTITASRLGISIPVTITVTP